MRVPTWLPCRLQIYFNGHNWLASQLRKRTIDYRLERSCLRGDRRLDASPGNRQRTATQMSASPLGAVRAPLLSPSSLLSGGLQCSLLRGEFNISGSQNKTLRRCLQGYNSGRVSRLLKCLRTHGLVKKIGRTYKYYVTAFGKQAVTPLLSCANSSSSRNSLRYLPCDLDFLPQNVRI